LPPVPQELEIAPPPCLQILRIEVWKRDRTLQALCKRGATIKMKVALGREEIGPKTRSGDHRTPEGKYRISDKASASRFHLFLPIDYPSKEDAEAAFSEGRVSRAEYHRVVRAHERGAPPPHDTALGGNLGFHGEGDRWRGDSEDLDWTYGCIAVTDAEIEFIAERVEPGVPVWIHP
jgi:murein L,D-transpeptidase YafK